MSWRGTFALIFVAALAIALLFASAKKQTRSSRDPLLSFDPDQVEKIFIREGSSTMTLLKKEGIWYLGGEQSDRADQQLIRSVLKSASSTAPSDILKASDLKGQVSLASLDLNQPKRSLTIQGKVRESIDFGTEGAAPGSLYARLGGGDIYLISDELPKLAFRSVQDFHDPHLTALNTEHLQEISLTKGGAIQQLTLKKGNRDWNLERPLSAKVDQGALSSWITPILSARIQQWMPAGTDPSTCGLESPRGVFALTQEGETNPVTIAIGDPLPSSPESCYVQCSDRSGIFIVKGLLAALDMTPQSLRSHTLQPVEYDTVDRIAISGNETGEPTVILTRKPASEDWTIKAPTGNAQSILPGEKVRAWFEQLGSITASSFAPATPDQLKLHGIDHPSCSIRYSAHLSENTAEESAGEFLLASYVFGPASKGVIALHEGDSSDLMILPEHPLEEILTRILQPSLPVALPSPDDSTPK